MAIGGAYRAFAAEMTRYPSSSDEIRGFLEAKKDIWSKYSQSVDAFLASPRDGEPMVLLTKETFGPVSPLGEPWVAYESKGADGMKRLVDGRGFFEDKPAQEVDALFGATQE